MTILPGLILILFNKIRLGITSFAFFLRVMARIDSTATITTLKVHDTLRANVCKMLTNRKYQVLENGHDQHKLWSQQIDHYVMGALKPNQQSMVVVFYGGKKNNMDQAVRWKESLQRLQIHHLLVVTVDFMGDNLLNELKNNETHPLTVENFCCHEMMHDLVSHKLVPVHEALTEVQSRDLVHMYKIKTIHQLPLYSVNDPVVRYYFWPVNTVVKISRNWGQLNQREVYYRVVADV